MVERDTPVKAVFKQDMFDFRFIHDREMVQSLLTEDEGDLLWHDEFDLVPLRAHVVPGMFLTLNSWSHTSLSIAAAQVLEDMKDVTRLCHWNHPKNIHSISGTGPMAGCQLWATLWESSLTNEGRASFHLEVECELQENSFCVTAKICKRSALPPGQFQLWWAVRVARSTLDCLRIPDGVFVAFKWCKRLIWEGHLQSTLSVSQLIYLLQTLWLPVLNGEEIRLIHGFSATRLQPEQNLQILHSLAQQGKAYVLHIVTRLQGGGSGKNPQVISLKNQVASCLLDSQYDLSGQPIPTPGTFCIGCADAWGKGVSRSSNRNQIPGASGQDPRT